MKSHEGVAFGGTKKHPNEMKDEERRDHVVSQQTTTGDGTETAEAGLINLLARSWE